MDSVPVPDVMTELTSVYERLVKLGVDTKEIKEMLAKVVGTVESTPDAGACLMEWTYY